MPSRHQHGYTYDLFVSYSSRDQDWVSPFIHDLTTDVNKFADFDIFPFLDTVRLQPGFVWDEALTSAAADAALLVPILSPRFFQSDYCQKEVNHFLEAFGRPSSAPHRSRILPVKFLCSAPRDHILATLQAAAFCANGADNIPLEFQKGTAEYHDGIRKLAVSIAQLLKTAPRKGEQKPVVYLAADFQPETEKLRASLTHTYDVLPLNPQAMLTMPAAELDQTLAADLGRCFVSVHTLTDAPMIKPLMEAQRAAALQIAKPRLILAPAAPPELLDRGFEWITSPGEVEDHIRRLAQRPAERKAGVKEPLIYFLCSDRRNKDLAAPLLTRLETEGICVYPSPLDGPADQALQTHVQALDELDGCLIYYGDVSQDWFNSVFLRVAKKIRQRALPSVIYLAPPPTDHKTKDLGNLPVPIVDQAEAAARAFRPQAFGAAP